MRGIVTVATLVLMVCAAGVGADEIYNEGTDGPLSVDPANPTVVTLVSSSDFVSGDGAGASSFFGFLVPVGETVSSIVVDPGSGGWQLGEFWFGATAAGPATCTGYNVQAPTEILDGGPNCAASLSDGPYVLGLTAVVGMPWTVTITSTVPVELQTFSVE